MEQTAAFKVLYTLEHRLLPQWFYKDKRVFVDAVVADPTMIYRIVSDMLSKEGEENPYAEDAFSSMRYKLTDDVLALKISFPKPEMEPLCFCSYLVFDKECERLVYFTIEKTAEPDAEAMVCSWNKENQHISLGACSFKEYGDLRKCADIYLHTK